MTVYECEISIAHKVRFDVTADSGADAVRLAKQIAAEKMNDNGYINGLTVSHKMIIDGKVEIIVE